jgi:streptogramin lyase
MRLGLALALPLCLTLAGCSLETAATPSAESGVALQGSVHGGQQPVYAAHVYLLAASTSGYGSASTSLLTSGDGSDSIGTYVLSDTQGHFNITGDYTCTPGQQVYLYAFGGDPGAGTNLSLGMMAAVGNCPSAGNFLTAVPFIVVNELSTVALAWSASGFATDALHIGSSGTALAKTGIANAFANTANLVSTAGGVALATTPAGNGTVPRTELNTLANILAACMNSSGAVTGPSNPTPCYTLFNSAKDGSSVPADTAGAAINIAHHPTANLSTLFGLQTATAPFAPGLTNAPNDFTVNLTFTGGGLGTSADQANLSSYTVNNIAIDAAGNVWKPNYTNNTITELNPLGAALSGSGGFRGGGLNTAANVAVDLNGNIWVGNYAGNSVSKFTSSGAPVSGSPYTGSGSISSPSNLAIDGSGNVWIANNSTLTKLDSSGNNVSGSPYSSNSLSAPVGIAILPNGNVWVSNAYANDVAVYNSSGGAVSGSPYSGGTQHFPYGIAFDSSGNGWIADDSAMTRLSSTGAAGTSPYNAPGGAIPTSVAVDGLGNAWVAEVGNNTILELNSSAAYVSGPVGFQYGETAVPEAVAVDGSGNLWYSTCNDATIHELVGAAAPAVTPLAYAVKNSLLGARP